MNLLSKHYSHNLRLIHRDEELDSVSDYHNAYREYCPVEQKQKNDIGISNFS